MQKNQSKTSIYDLSLFELQTFFKEKGLTAFAGGQVFQWIYQKFQYDVDKWTNVSKRGRELLKESFDFSLPQVIWAAMAKDGTRKFLIRMQDGETVESVLIYAQGRVTQCISTQVGCAIGCTFCHTGTQGLKRHLRPGEIVGQYLTVGEWLKMNHFHHERISNIVYMGQGEPLHNFENVKVATQTFLETKGLGLGQRRITLSTSGLVPQIKKLGEFPPVNIAISLHAAHDNIRTELMPINKVYDLKRLFEAIQTIPLKAYRRITYEYLLVEGLNDRPEDIEALVKLLDRKKSKINLIPFNEFPGSHYKRPGERKIQWFTEELNRRGLTCTVRATKGSDILAACGQLKTERERKNVWTETLKENLS